MLKERIDELVKGSNHIVLIGSRGQGKTSLGYYLLELHKNAGRKTYVYQHPKPSLLPKWIHNITKVGNLPKDAVLLIDESANDFDQYSYAKRNNVYLRNKLTSARHKNQSYIFICLTTSFINKNFMHMINAWFLKQPTLFQREEERKVVRMAYSRIQEELEKDEFYYLDDMEFVKGKFSLPEWYNDKLSTAYSEIDAEKI